MEDITMDQEKRIQDAADLAMNYQLAINEGELDKAFEMVLPKERDAVRKEAYIKEKLGVDTIIENLISKSRRRLMMKSQKSIELV